ncbi:MAG: 50S ribosomal protein L6 [uncultured bacterium]|nr:MAG: 50S ribosomal protein L6 [uncultured bacterium]
MSRIGKKPIKIPKGVTVEINDSVVKVKGPKGELIQNIHPHVKVAKDGDEFLRIFVKNSNQKDDRALWGLFGALIKNMIEGVVKGFEKKLEFHGVGFKVAVAGNKMTLNVGFSHPVEFTIPQGIEAKVEKNVITIFGIDKQLVGETAAQVKRVKKVEPYKGKGIRYTDEVVRRKAGKVVKTAEGA